MLSKELWFGAERTFSEKANLVKSNPIWYCASLDLDSHDRNFIDRQKSKLVALSALVSGARLRKLKADADLMWV
jgi:hypothetical protein